MAPKKRNLADEAEMTRYWAEHPDELSLAVKWARKGKFTTAYRKTVNSWMKLDPKIARFLACTLYPQLSLDRLEKAQRGQSTAVHELLYFALAIDGKRLPPPKGVADNGGDVDENVEQIWEWAVRRHTTLSIQLVSTDVKQILQDHPEQPNKSVVRISLRMFKLMPEYGSPPAQVLANGEDAVPEEHVYSRLACQALAVDVALPAHWHATKANATLLDNFSYQTARLQFSSDMKVKHSLADVVAQYARGLAECDEKAALIARIALLDGYDLAPRPLVDPQQREKLALALVS
eukprot:6488940-Amphidinium_carterae.2